MGPRGIVLRFIKYLRLKKVIVELHVNYISVESEYILTCLIGSRVEVLKSEYSKSKKLLKFLVSQSAKIIKDIKFQIRDPRNTRCSGWLRNLLVQLPALQLLVFCLLIFSQMRKQSPDWVILSNPHSQLRAQLD